METLYRLKKQLPFSTPFSKIILFILLFLLLLASLEKWGFFNVERIKRRVIEEVEIFERGSEYKMKYKMKKEFFEKARR